MTNPEIQRRLRRKLALHRSASTEEQLRLARGLEAQLGEDLGRVAGELATASMRRALLELLEEVEKPRARET